MLELHPDEAGLAAAMVAEALRRDAADALRSEKKRAKRAANRGGRGEGGATHSFEPQLEKEPGPEKADDVAIAALVVKDVEEEKRIEETPDPNIAVGEGPVGGVAGAAGVAPTGFL
jgi:hypothetical protein